MIRDERWKEKTKKETMKSSISPKNPFPVQEKKRRNSSSRWSEEAS